MIFTWDQQNCDHLAKHNVSPGEAEWIVRGATAPYPLDAGDDKLLVWGQTESGRYLQVVFVLQKPSDVQYESLYMEEWLEVDEGATEEIVRVIHAMELTTPMKRRLKRRRR